MNTTSRDVRFTWGDAESDRPEIIPGSGKALDLDSWLSGEAEEERGKAKDKDGPAVHIISLGHGLTFVCETPMGSVRSGKDFAVRMPAHYGYIDGVTGADGDSLDAYYGPGPGNGWVYVVDQKQLDGKSFDEHKCMLNFPSQQAAVDAYMAGHHRAEDAFMDFTPMPLSDFARWVQEHDMRKPCSL